MYNKIKGVTLNSTQNNKMNTKKTQINIHIWNKVNVHKWTLIIIFIREDNVGYWPIAVVKANEWLQFLDYTIYIGKELFVSLYWEDLI